MGAMMRRPWNQKGLRRPSLVRIGSRVRRPGGGGPEPIDLNMLFDVAFTAGLDGSGNVCGFYTTTDSEASPFGTLEQMLPSDFISGEYAQVNAVSAFPAGEGASPAALNIGAVLEKFPEMGWDIGGGQVARLYNEGALIAQADNNQYVGATTGQADFQLGETAVPPVFFDNGGHYRIRVWDHEPPADEMMLFEIVGTTAEFDPGSFGFSWINPADAGDLTAIGTIVSQTPDDYLPPAGIGQGGGQVYGGDGYVGVGVYVAYDAIPGFSWGYAEADVRLYGDSGHIATASGVPFVKDGDILRVNAQFPGKTLADGETYRARVWIDPARIIST